jgi:hypothetical protein
MSVAGSRQEREPTHASLLWLEHFSGEGCRPMVFFTELYGVLMKITPWDRLFLRKIAGLTQTRTWATVREARIHDALRVLHTNFVISNTDGPEELADRQRPEH